jgi:NAD(P)-dependent dehydrogenase (short-subunit alcohol dehydrogenase family)
LELCKQLAEGGSYASVFALCRKTTDELNQLAAQSNKIKVVEGVEVTKDDAASVLQEAFRTKAQPIPIHLLVHNAGGYGPPGGSLTDYTSQTLDNITTERMRYAFDLNTIAPLMLTQALVPNLEVAASSAEDPAKVVIISSAMGSIEENTSGGHYGYRTAKAGVNMVGKSLSVDLKDKNIAVGLGECLFEESLQRYDLANFLTISHCRRCC